MVLTVYASRLLATTTKTAFAGHVILSFSSMAYGCLASGASPIQDTDANELSAPVSEFVLDTITQMYSGHGILSTKGFCRSVVFEDPAAKCVGINEISEAFRALQWCQPVSLSKPKIIGNAATLDRTGLGVMVVLELHQKYFDKFKVKSLIVVEVDETGLIKRIEERWNGASLLSARPFSISRRFNGLLSFAATQILIR